MVYTNMTRKAMQLAYKAHHGQTDRSGVPYIFHPLHLAEQMTDEITVCVALLHDVAEDTDITLADLEKEFPEEVMKPLRLLTRDKDTDYFDYVTALCQDPIAKKVKLADVQHNYNAARLACCDTESPETIQRLKTKYKKTLSILQKN